MPFNKETKTKPLFHMYLLLYLTKENLKEILNKHVLLFAKIMQLAHSKNVYDGFFFI